MRISELIQLLTGMSIKRYLLARGTAGFARSLVRGYKRVPAPPPKIIPNTLFTLLLNLATAFASQVKVYPNV